MPDYTVEQGDCIWSIAKGAGLPPETIWNHPNNAELKNKRVNPNILFPGDIVFVPDLTIREDPRGTDQLHKFQKKSFTAKLCIRLLDDDDPRANEKYTLIVNGARLSGQTDGDGFLEQRIPADAREGELLLKDGSEQHTIQLGYLDPIDEIAGIQGRLQNLGFYGGEIDGEMSDATVAAIMGFQSDQQIDQTGEADSATKSALKAAYLS
jgi:hypothetical protein